METQFKFNADAEKATIQELFDSVMKHIEHNLNNGIRNTWISVPIQYASDVREMVEKTLFIGNHSFDWGTFSSGNMSRTISETYNGVRTYKLVYYGN